MKIINEKVSNLIVAINILWLTSSAGVRYELIGQHFNNVLNDTMDFLLGKEKSIFYYYQNAKLWTETDYDFKEFSLIHPEFFKPDFAARMMVYLRPIVGIVKNKFLYNPNNILCGEHSTILDTVSILGFFSIIYFYIISKAYTDSLKNVNDKLKLLTIAYIFVASFFDRMIIFEMLLFPIAVVPILACEKYEE